MQELIETYPDYDDNYCELDENCFEMVMLDYSGLIFDPLTIIINFKNSKTDVFLDAIDRNKYLSILELDSTSQLYGLIKLNIVLQEEGNKFSTLTNLLIIDFADKIVHRFAPTKVYEPNDEELNEIINTDINNLLSDTVASELPNYAFSELQYHPMDDSQQFDVNSSAEMSYEMTFNMSVAFVTKIAVLLALDESLEKIHDDIDSDINRFMNAVQDQYFNENEIEYGITPGQPFTAATLETLQLSELLGEGAFGAVFKTADGRYAVKIQGGQLDCMREASIQYDVAQIPKVAIAKVYFFSNQIRSIPQGWRSVIQRTSQKKGTDWASQGWSGQFCIIVMDLLKSTKQLRISRADIAAYVFGLLFTVQEGYKNQGFQHLDIHSGNVTVVPNPTGQFVVTDCRSKGIQWVFNGVKNDVRLLDFGISINKKYPRTVTYNGRICPPETLIQQISGKMFVPYDTFDHYSIGLLILDNVLGARGNPKEFTMGSLPLVGADALLNYIIQGRTQIAQLAINLVNISVLEYAIGNGPYPTGIQFLPGTLEYALFIEPQNQAQLNAICQANAPYRTQILREAAQLYGDGLVYLIKQLISWTPANRRIDLANHPYFKPYITRCQ